MWRTSSQFAMTQQARWKRGSGVPRVLAIALLMVSAPSCGPGGGKTEADLAEERRGRELQQRWESWFRSQHGQDCPPGPYDPEATEAVVAVWQGLAKARVFGAPDPFQRKARSLGTLRTRPNPRGDGVIVTSWEDKESEGSADFSRRRRAWLVLDGAVFPVDSYSAGAIGRVFEGMPEKVQKRAGLIHTYERERTMMHQLGLEPYSYERRFSGNNPFPTCRE